MKDGECVEEAAGGGGSGPPMMMVQQRLRTTLDEAASQKRGCGIGLAGPGKHRHSKSLSHQIGDRKNPQNIMVTRVTEKQKGQESEGWDPIHPPGVQSHFLGAYQGVLSLVLPSQAARWMRIFGN